MYMLVKASSRKNIEQTAFIAVTTVNELDIIVSMNYEHIVKRKTILATGKINNLYGYRVIEIYSPMEVVENEKT